MDARYRVRHKNGKEYIVTFPKELDSPQQQIEAYEWCAKIYGGIASDWYLTRIDQGDQNFWDPGLPAGTIAHNIPKDVHSPYFLWPYADTTPEFKKEMPGQFVQQKCECGAEITFGQEVAKTSRLHSDWCPKK